MYLQVLEAYIYQWRDGEGPFFVKISEPDLDPEDIGRVPYVRG